MIAQIITFVVLGWLSYACGYAKGRRVGWELAKRLPCLRRMPAE